MAIKSLNHRDLTQKEDLRKKFNQDYYYKLRKSKGRKKYKLLNSNLAILLGVSTSNGHNQDRISIIKKVYKKHRKSIKMEKQLRRKSRVSSTLEGIIP